MTKEMWIYLAVIVYISIVLAVVVRAVEEKAPFVIFVSPFIPALLILINLIVSISMFVQSKRKFRNRIRDFVLTTIFAFECLPIFLGYLVRSLAKSTLNKNIETILSKTIDVAILRKHTLAFYNGYTDFFVSGMKKNKYHMLRLN